jgi:hypothetical protein
MVADYSEWEGLYTGRSVSSGHFYPEATMPRFVGRNIKSVLWEIILFVLLVVVVVVVLLLTGVIPAFGS